MRAVWMAVLDRGGPRRGERRPPRRGGAARGRPRRHREMATGDSEYEDASEGYEGKGKRLRHRRTGKYRYVYDDVGGAAAGGPSERARSVREDRSGTGVPLVDAVVDAADAALGSLLKLWLGEDFAEHDQGGAAAGRRRAAAQRPGGRRTPTKDEVDRAVGTMG